MNAQNSNTETQAMNTNNNPAPLWARAAVTACGFVWRHGKPILYTIAAGAAAIIGAIVIVNFAKFFAEMSLTMSNLSIESTEGGLLVLAVYCTAFYVYFQWLPNVYKSFKNIVNSINIERNV